MLSAVPMNNAPLPIPPGTIAAALLALPPKGQPTPAFRQAACATLRVSRARGRLECEALGSSFEGEAADDRRVLILDLLASAGTPEAQIVMRRVLSIASARRNAGTFASFVQRLGFVERPDCETVAFLMGIYVDAQAELRPIAAYALGTAAGRAHVWGLVEPALRACAVLRRDLGRAVSVTDKCALVTALGNAGLETEVATILRLVEDRDEDVRSAAVLALRKMHTPEAKAWLLSALADSAKLAESALSALFEQSLSSDELVRLADLVLAGRTAIALDVRVLRLIVMQRLTTANGGRAVEQAIQLLQHRIDGRAFHMAGLSRTATPPSRMSLSEESGEYARYAGGGLPRREPLLPPPLPADSEVRRAEPRDLASIVFNAGIRPLAVIR